MEPFVGDEVVIDAREHQGELGGLVAGRDGARCRANAAIGHAPEIGQHGADRGLGRAEIAQRQVMMEEKFTASAGSVANRGALRHLPGVESRGEEPSMKITDRKLDTKLIHAGEPSPRIQGSVAMPVFLSSTFEYVGDGSAGYDAVRYARLSNTPNHVALHEKLAALENAEAALVTGSGMAAISAASSACSARAITCCAALPLRRHPRARSPGISPSWGSRSISSTPAIRRRSPQALRPNTSAFYVETMTNPLLEVADLPAVAAFRRERQWPGLDHRQHLRQPGELPADRARLRSGRSTAAPSTSTGTRTSSPARCWARPSSWPR